MEYVKVQVTPGEVTDRMSILLLKQKRLEEGPAGNDEKLAQVTREYKTLNLAYWSYLNSDNALSTISFSPIVSVLSDNLETVNQELWDVEDSLRCWEAKHGFGDTFIELARSVYKLNDLRSDIKRRIDAEFGVSADVKIYIADAPADAPAAAPADAPLSPGVVGDEPRTVVCILGGCVSGVFSSKPSGVVDVIDFDGDQFDDSLPVYDVWTPRPFEDAPEDVKDALADFPKE